MARNLLQRQPDRDGDADLALDVAGEARQRPRRRSCRAARSVPARSRNASSIDSGSTSGVSACISARTSRPTRTYFAMSGVITTASGHSRQRLEHRHRRAHAEGARDVAGGRDDAALAAADDHRLVGEARDRRASRPWRRRRRSRHGRSSARRARGGGPGAASRRRRSAWPAVAIAEAVAAETGRQLTRWRGCGHGTSRSQAGRSSAWCAAVDAGGVELRDARQKPSRLRRRAG